MTGKRDPGGVRRAPGHPKRADVPDEDILRLRGLGLSWQAIALETGMSRTGVRLRHGALTGRERPDRPASPARRKPVTAPPVYDRAAPVGVAEVAERAGAETAAALAADPEMTGAAKWTVNGSPAWPWRDVLRWGVRTGVIQSGVFPYPDRDTAALERPGYTGVRERLGDLPGWLLRGTALDPGSRCLVYVARTDEDGYGRSPDKRLVHRVAWKLLVGPIPEEVTLDHRHDLGCQSSACWALWHLEPVTAAENRRRQRSRRRR